MHNGDVPAFHLENKYLPSLYGFILVVGEEEKIPTVEGWLHTTTAQEIHAK